MRVVAHRGARRLALENTLEALHVAYEEAADGVEFDVQITACGEPILFHDDTLEALHGWNLRIQDVPWRTLRGLELRDREGRSGRIPHLDEALELLERRRGFRNLELKVVAGEGSRLADVVVRRLALLSPEDWWVSSFDARCLAAFAGAMLPIGLGALVDERGGDFARLAGRGPRAMGAIADACRAIGPQLRAIHPYHGHVDEERLALWRGAGLAVHVWTVNDARGWQRLTAAGIEACITDDPTGLLALQERG